MFEPLKASIIGRAEKKEHFIGLIKNEFNFLAFKSETHLQNNIVFYSKIAFSISKKGIGELFIIVCIFK